MSDVVFHDAIAADALADGENLACQVAGRDVLLCRAKGEWFAVENQCSHAMAPLEGARLRAYRLICPLHGAAFDVRDGSVKGKPAFEPIKAYPVKVDSGRVLVGVTPE